MTEPVQAGDAVPELREEDLGAEALYRLIVERSVAGVLIWNERGIVYANGAFLRMTGRVHAEVRGLDPFEMVAPEDRALVKDRALQRLQGLEVPNTYEFRIVTPTGEKRWLRLLATLLRYRGRPAILGTFIDVTEHRQAQEALRASEELNRLVMDSLPHPAILVREDRVILAANRLARELGADVGDFCWRGFGKEAFLPASDPNGPPKGGPPPQRSRMHCSFCRGDEALRKRQPVNLPRLEAFGQVWDAWWIPVDEGVYLHYAVNVTERVRAETLIRENEERYHLLTESMGEGLVIQDAQNRIVNVNQKACGMIGWPEGEVLGQSLPDFLAAGQEMDARALREPGKNNDKEPLRLQAFLKNKNGKAFPVNITMRPLYGSEGRLRGSYAFLEDISELTRLRQHVELGRSFAGMVGRHGSMGRLFEEIRDAAQYDFPVLIQGESGTGKELVAKAIHALGPRAKRRFVPVNCAALAEGVLESELFGHVKGAFTGALKDKRGRFALADGGSIFLDEVGDLSPGLQVKLLRVLQEGTVERVGDEQTLRVNVRVLSATNKNLREEMLAGRFRKDLFYRLSAVPMMVPPLRERRSDIPFLSEYLLEVLAVKGDAPKTVSREAVSLLIGYDWPGNVRELQNVIQFAIVKSRDGEIRPEHLPPMIREFRATEKRLGTHRGKLTAETVAEALGQAKGNKARAARILGVSRATLYRFMARR